MRNCGTDMGTGELRDDLKALGHKFDAHSGTEVLLRAYTEWGSECVACHIYVFPAFTNISATSGA